MAIINQEKLKQKLEEARYRPKKAAILIVDDEEQNLTVLQQALWDDYEVLQATSGLEALTILAEPAAKLPIQVVIADYRMPTMDGVELLGRVRKLYPGIVRIMLSGQFERDSIIEAINIGGIYQFLTKPFERNHLRLTIDGAVETAKLNVENARLVVELRERNTELEIKSQELEKTIAILKAAAARIRGSQEGAPAGNKKPHDPASADGSKVPDAVRILRGEKK